MLGRYLTAFRAGAGVLWVGQSERPDVVCGKLKRAGWLFRGTPSVLLVPFLVCGELSNPDDYLARPFYGTFIRWLKLPGLLLSAFCPGCMYVVLHHPEMLPESPLLKIAQAQAQTPCPCCQETLLLTLRGPAGGGPGGRPGPSRPR